MRSLTAFVAMPFGAEFDDIFIHGVRPIGNSFPGWDITVTRADVASGHSMELWTHVRMLIGSADLILGDITGSNPNVMLELGFAMATGKHCILFSQDEIPAANIRGQLYVRYSAQDWNGLQRKLLQQVEQAVQRVVAAQSRMQPSALGAGRSMWKSAPPSHRDGLPKKATNLRDLGFLARERGNNGEAIDQYSAALESCAGYWEVKYDLALTLSLQKEESRAASLAREAAADALVGGDFTTAWKAHNLQSGIHTRANRLQEALSEIRMAWQLSHMPQALDGGVPHIIPIKNRAVLEAILKNQSECLMMIAELRAHPALREVEDVVKKELGPLWAN